MNKRILKKKEKSDNRKLVQEFPFLLPRNVWTDKVDPSYDYSYTLADNIPSGWRKAFGMDLFRELKEELVRVNYLYDFRFEEIKEKYGSLRLYCGSVPADSKIYDILDKYEKISETVCEKCGKKDQVIINYRGWYQCICPDCLNRREEELFRQGCIRKPLAYSDFLE